MVLLSNLWLKFVYIIYFLSITTASSDDYEEEMEFEDDAVENFFMREEMDSIPGWTLSNKEENGDYARELISLVNKDGPEKIESDFELAINRKKRSENPASNTHSSSNDDTDVENADEFSYFEFDYTKENEDESNNRDDDESFIDIFRKWKIQNNDKENKNQKECPEFPSASSISTVTCNAINTLLGPIRWCRIDCDPGYRLKPSNRLYEICGQATGFRWSYELKGGIHPTDACEAGIATESGSEICTTPECFAAAAFYMNKIDYSVDPCDNFFDFSCGKWIKEMKIPEDKSFYITYSVIRDRVNKQVSELLQKEILPNDLMPVVKAKKFFRSCMDTDLIEKLDIGPLIKILRGELTWPIIEPSWKNDQFDFESTVATLRGKYNNKLMLSVKIGTIDDTYMLETWKGHMPLPYDYYFKESLISKLDKYYNLIYDVALMLGADPILALWDIGEMGKFEIELAKIKAGSINILQKSTIGSLQASIPGINWLKMFKKMINKHNISSQTPVAIWDQLYLENLNKLIKQTDKRVVQNFMVWTNVKLRIKNLSQRFQNRLLDFEKLVNGKKALQPREEKCAMEAMFGMKGATSKLFIDAYFSDHKKMAAEEIFEFIKKGFIHLLEKEVEWMDSETKSYAKRKALAIKSHVGFNPQLYQNDTYLSQSVEKVGYHGPEPLELSINPSDYFGNYLRLLELSAQNSFSKLGRFHNRSDYSFDVRATMVNAFYSTRYNAMVVPGGELQYPFYWGESFQRVLEFGAIGTILGHELTHGFDNLGRKFDLSGNMKNWWSSKSVEEFNKRRDCIKDQYGEFFWEKAGQYLNGAKELAENIADNGGIRESYTAYHIWLKSRNISSEPIHPAIGLTNDQLFFVAFANDRCGQYTHDGALHSLALNPHSPGRFRVIGSLQNFGEFSKAFECPVGSYMNPKHKCVIW